jgi:hypothetical protein
VLALCSETGVGSPGPKLVGLAVLYLVAALSWWEPEAARLGTAGMSVNKAYLALFLSWRSAL